MNRASLRAPLFIGSFRSGTTLLVNLLGLHPDIAPWFETKALCEALRWMKVLNRPECAEFEAGHIIPPHPAGFHPAAVAERMRHDFRTTAARILGEAPSGKMAHERYPIGYDHVLYDFDEAEAALNDWLAGCGSPPTPDTVAVATGHLIRTLAELQVQRAGKSIWVNKTPGIPRFIPELWRCLGPCRMAMLIRNGRRVAASASRLGWARGIEIAHWWKVLIEEARSGSKAHPDYYLEMRYEDLIGNPEYEVNRLLRFMGLDPVGDQLVAEYRRRMGSDAFQVDTRTTPAGLPDVDWAEFDAIAGCLMRQLGYQ